MYFRFPKIFKRITRPLLWRVKSDDTVYLTFDDGPTEGITEQILDILDNYGAKATFFCIGKNARRHPELVDKIIERGHAVGNHTFDHAKGWLMPTQAYIDSIQRAADFLPPTRLFRPPYGRLAVREARVLVEQGWKIVMWNNISQDYNRKISPRRCTLKVTRHLHPGDIIVFHDSLKASPNMLYALPVVLEAIRRKGLKTDILV